MATASKMLDTGGRLYELGWLDAIPRVGPTRYWSYSGLGDEIAAWERFERNLYRASVDWDEIFRHTNAVIDEAVSILEEPARPQRLRKLRALTNSVPPLDGDFYDYWGGLAFVFDRGATESMFRFTFNTSLDELGGYAVLEDNVLARTRMMEIVARLVLHRRVHGGYPDSLDALLQVNESTDGITPPKASLLNDPFAETGRFQYRIDGDGFLLYSVGENGNDDDGFRMRTDGQWITVRDPRDDIAVRVGPDGMVPYSKWHTPLAPETSPMMGMESEHSMFE